MNPYFVVTGRLARSHAMMPPAWLKTVSKTGLFQHAAGARRAVAAAAGDQDRLALELLEFLQAIGELTQRNMLGLGDVAGGIFLVLAHVEHQCIVIEQTGGF
jgi:hypothetical protein